MASMLGYSPLLWCAQDCWKNCTQAVQGTDEIQEMLRFGQYYLEEGNLPSNFLLVMSEFLTFSKQKISNRPPCHASSVFRLSKARAVQAAAFPGADVLLLAGGSEISSRRLHTEDLWAETHSKWTPGVLQRLSGGGGEGRRGISIQERKANLLSLDKIFSKMHTSVALSTMDPGFGEGSRTSKVTPVTHKECPKCGVMFGRQLRKWPHQIALQASLWYIFLADEYVEGPRSERVAQCLVQWVWAV